MGDTRNLTYKREGNDMTIDGVRGKYDNITKWKTYGYRRLTENEMVVTSGSLWR